MDLQLTGKTALVTGASQGIGRAISRGSRRKVSMSRLWRAARICSGARQFFW
jgi:NAD(P)-dependent dehydrogenase (short-subunit alcohol dehydrogenase family)